MEVKEEVEIKLEKEDNMKNLILESPLPDCVKSEPCWLGIDEAGRGPVLGPMVYGICFSPISMKEKFGEMGFADSKTLTEEQRESIFDKINEANDMIGWMVEVLSPTFISTSMLRRTKYNLNALSHDCAIRLVALAIERGANIAEVYVDTVGDPTKYQEKLKGIFPSIDITVAKKADSLYPIVSAASICAKVTRDKAVKKWKFQEEINTEDLQYGSGYPADPNTKSFLANNMDYVFGFPQFVRFSWSTAAIILEKDAAPVKWEDDDEDENADKSNMALTSFFCKKDHNPKMDRHIYFKDRCIETVQKL
ncbi:ribonuclease H2 subunit A [Mytilus galloprovincialis]|uniref:Ribonuclease n=1 Tax=Mytilus galloprovincialis TaxID=29158 RepID=A0A8B6EBH2_MYTGA|nr:ribonuclease H2 subunit A [Mytilus galloprovincialis]